jgi:hypothetical protein
VVWYGTTMMFSTLALRYGGRVWNGRSEPRRLRVSSRRIISRWSSILLAAHLFRNILPGLPSSRAQRQYGEHCTFLSQSSNSDVACRIKLPRRHRGTTLISLSKTTESSKIYFVKVEVSLLHINNPHASHCNNII